MFKSLLVGMAVLLGVTLGSTKTADAQIFRGIGNRVGLGVGLGIGGIGNGFFGLGQGLRTGLLLQSRVGRGILIGESIQRQRIQNQLFRQQLLLNQQRLINRGFNRQRVIVVPQRVRRVQRVVVPRQRVVERVVRDRFGRLVRVRQVVRGR